MDTMTLEQAIKNAIGIEKGAKKFYERLAANSKDEKVQAFFESMATQEQDHADWIGDVAEMLDAGKLPLKADAKVYGVEKAPGWVDVPDIQLDEAVALALEAENSAALYYDAMADQTSGVTQELFQKLTEIEEQHAEALESFRAMHLAQ